MKEKPSCFDSDHQYKLWLRAHHQMKDTGSKPDICHDCSPEYKAKMQAEGRCIRPKTREELAEERKAERLARQAELRRETEARKAKLERQMAERKKERMKSAPRRKRIEGVTYLRADYVAELLGIKNPA